MYSKKTAFLRRKLEVVVMRVCPRGGCARESVPGSRGVMRHVGGAVGWWGGVVCAEVAGETRGSTIWRARDI